MKAWVDKDTCIACGACYAIAPEVFEADEDGFAQAIQELVIAGLEADAEEARDGCPTESIKLED